MKNSFDVIVIGTGSIGTTVALACSRRDRRVALIDHRSFGGTCALRGCVPKKILVGAAEIMDRTIDMEGKGVRGDAEIDWQRLVEFKKSFTDPYPGNLEKTVSEAGIETYHGKARFGSEESLVVDGNEIHGTHIVIATGAKPRELGIPGEEFVTTSDEFLELGTLPERMIFIGGGYISFEFAHVAMRAGVTVEILHRSDRVLNGFEKDIVDMLVKASREKGITIRTNVEVTGIERRSGSLLVSTGSSKQYEADLVVHGAGRVPALEDLDPGSAGVRSGPRGVAVNEYMQSVTNDRVYAGGDAADSGLPLTPVAVRQGKVIARNILEGNNETFDVSVTPTVVFTVPPLASVGMDEASAKERGVDYRVIMEDTSSWFTSRRIGLEHSGFKVLVEKESDRIIGAHILGHGAGEMINVFALAMRLAVSAGDLEEMVWSYPTSTSDIQYML